MDAEEAVPETVTRFYPNLDYALDVIANKQITFVNTSLLNDPFDLYLFFETDFEDRHDRLIQYVAEHHPYDLAWFKEAVTAEAWNNTRHTISSYFEELQKNTFVFSASASVDDINPRQSLYMWGHYGDGHRGVAIEFYSSALSKSVVKHSAPIKDGPSSPWVKIDYRRQFFPMKAADYFRCVKDLRQTLHQREDFDAPILQAHFAKMIRAKSDAWGRENEWRLMWTNNDTRMRTYKIPITNDSIAAISLGFRTPDVRVQDFIFEMQKNFPAGKIFIPSKRYGDFALDFKDHHDLPQS